MILCGESTIQLVAMVLLYGGVSMTNNVELLYFQLILKGEKQVLLMLGVILNDEWLLIVLGAALS
jgi:hypothetical protein